MIPSNIRKENIEEFDFFKALNQPKIYRYLFPKKEVGLAIILLYTKIKEGTFEDEYFTEKDIHNAFAMAHGPYERYQKEDYSENILELQEYFLDYNQNTQKYFFKDYAYKFCEHAYQTFDGELNSTRIEEICEKLTESLKKVNSLKELIYWFEVDYDYFKPALREQIDFLERQIINSVDEFKKITDTSGQSFVEALENIKINIDLAQTQSKELRSAYTQTKTVRILLDEFEFDDSQITDFISEVHNFFRYVNERLNSVDRKLERIQPRIRQLYSGLNKPRFNLKIQKFTRFLLNKSELVYQGNKKIIVFPNEITVPELYTSNPNFTIVERNKNLFPPKPKKRKKYVQNITKIEENKRKVLHEIEAQKRISHWEKLIISEIDLRSEINLSRTFFEILNEENDEQIAVNVLHNIIVYSYNSKKYRLQTTKELELNKHIKNVSLWKMKITKSQ